METVEQILRDEKNPDILREISLFILEQSRHLSAEITRLKAEQAKREAEKQEFLNSEIKAHLHKLRRRIFDHGRESLPPRDYERKIDQKQGILLHAVSLAGEVKPEEVKDLPEESIYYGASADEVIALAQAKDPGLTKSNAQIKEMDGFYEEATEIMVTERVYKKVIHKRQKIKITNLDTKKETIVTAKGPVKLLPGCKYSVDFALSIVAGKFLNHLPCDRQRKEIRRLGLKLPTATLTRLCEMVAIHLEKTVEKIRGDIFSANLSVHVDETRWPILNKHQDDGQMWILANQAGSYYRFEPTRSGEIAKELLSGYSGAVLTDKYSGYFHLRNTKHIKWGLCWAHARREFYDLIEVYPDVVTEVIKGIDLLFAYEREARTWDELKKIREEKSQPKTKELFALLQKVRAEFFNQDALCKAAHYVLSGWTEFTAFLEDARLPLSNNAAERALRHAVLGRKNFNGSKTINGADAAATLYSVIESCKRVQLDPVDYMKYVITENHHGREPDAPLQRAKTLRGVSSLNGKQESHLIESAV